MKKPSSTKKVIIVTGTPSTGKTTIAKELSLLLNIKYIDVNKLVNRKKLYSGYDKARNTKIVPIQPLIRELKRIIANSESSLIIDSHMSHFLPSSIVDLCIVVKCSLKKLKQRLEKKGYSAEKVRENLDSEIFDVCLSEAKEKMHNILIIDTSKKINLSSIGIKIRKKLFLS